MRAIGRLFSNERAAALAVAAGADVLLDPPDAEAALRGIRAAIDAGEIATAQLDRSVERVLRAKARLGLQRSRLVDVEAVPEALGGRARQALADEIARRAVTLLKDDRGLVPLRLPAASRVLALSLVDYASGWREGAPGRILLPAIKARFAEVTAVEVSDQTSASELELVRALARRSELVVAATFVRAASGSGRMDLSAAQQALVEQLGKDGERPVVLVAFGNPYVAVLAAHVPALLLTYELGDAAEAAAARALFGQAAIGGKLPITLPGLFPFGHGLERAALSAPS
jgi:beta-N-acetylhexosaminidase